MKPLLYYALQVIIVSGLLYGYYHLFLRNKKFHHYNRFYLLGAVFLSLLVPLLNIPVYFSEADKYSSVVFQTLSAISIPVSPNQADASHDLIQRSNFFSATNLFIIIYSLIVFVAVIRIVLSVYKLKRIIRTNPVQQADKILLINTEEPGTPFSFFRWLFWNRKIEMNSAKGRQIFRHELFHIEQKHSLDVMFMEVVTAFCWFNPFFYLMRKEIKAIHEFLADRFAVTEQTRWEYAELLLMRAMGTHQSLVNPFFHNQIKRRIAMITTSRKPGHQYLRKLMVLPLVAIATLMFAFTYKTKSADAARLLSQRTDSIPFLTMKGIMYEKKNNIIIEADTIVVKSKPAKSKILNADDRLIIINGEKTDYTSFLSKTYFAASIELYAENDPEAIRLYGNEAKKGVMVLKNAKIVDTPMHDYYRDELKKINGKNNAGKIFDRVEIDPGFPGGQEKWRQYLAQKLNASIPVTNKAPDGTYSVIVQFVVNEDGSINDVQTLTKFGYGMEEEAIRVIKLGPKWLPAIQNGIKVKAYKKQPVTFIVGKGDKNYKGSTFSGNDALNEVVVVSLQQQTPAKFPGEDEGWKNFLVKNIRSTVPVDSGANPGQYKTIIQFIVNPDGSLSDFKPITNHGYGMEAEVIRLLKAGPAWIPAMADGKKIRSFVQQPVTFVIAEETGDPGPERNTAPVIPGISVSEIKSAAPFELLQLVKETDIISYRFTTDMQNGDISESYNKGSQFNDFTKKLIAGITPGRLVTIDEIKIVKDGKEIKLPGLAYKVTN